MGYRQKDICSRSTIHVLLLNLPHSRQARVCGLVSAASMSEMKTSYPCGRHHPPGQQSTELPAKASPVSSTSHGRGPSWSTRSPGDQARQEHINVPQDLFVNAALAGVRKLLSRVEQPPVTLVQAMSAARRWRCGRCRCLLHWTRARS